MRRRMDIGVWEIFVPGSAKARLQYESGPAGELLPLKADPVGFGAELRPSTASVVRDTRPCWTDAQWMAERRGATRAARPWRPTSCIGILAARRRGALPRLDEIADRLLPNLADLGFSTWS